MSQAKAFRMVVLAAVLGSAGQTLAAPGPEAAKGYQVYMAKGCYECHGTVGQGGAAGPKLAPNPLPAQAIMAIIRKPIREMPPFNSDVVSDDEVAAIHAYLASIKPAPAVDSLAPLRPYIAQP